MTLVRPVTDEEALRNLATLPADQLRPEFVQVQFCRNRILGYPRVDAGDGVPGYTVGDRHALCAPHPLLFPKVLGKHLPIFLLAHSLLRLD